MKLQLNKNGYKYCLTHGPKEVYEDSIRKTIKKVPWLLNWETKIESEWFVVSGRPVELNLDQEYIRSHSPRRSTF